MLDVRRLRLLRELTRRGTIVAVADALGYTPSAVSQQLATLEREAGVPLLERTGRQVAPTPAALALTEYTEAILDLLEQASAMLAATRDGLAGPLRIGAFASATGTFLPAAVIALARAHPELELTIGELDPADVASAIRDETVDVALVHEYEYVPAEPDPAVDTEPLLEETIFLAHLAEPPGAGTEADTAAGPGTEAADPIRARRSAPWIIGVPGTLCHEMAVRACQAAGFTPRVRHHAEDFATVLALVAAGQGVALVPRLGVLDPPPGVVLTPLPARRRTAVAFRRGRRRDPAIAAFVTAIRDAVADWDLP